jgi:hypothetical protein
MSDFIRRRNSLGGEEDILLVIYNSAFNYTPHLDNAAPIKHRA